MNVSYTGTENRKNSKYRLTVGTEVVKHMSSKCEA